jgi:hypothetical protein
MRAVVTRVSSASVTIDGAVRGAIEKGYLVLLGVGPQDTEAVCDKLAEKICNLRIFEDENGKMNLNLEQVGGALLVVSQFTPTPRAAALVLPGRPSPMWPFPSMSDLWTSAVSGGSRWSMGSSERICRWRRSTTGRSPSYLNYE